ncbi:hypothetical protein ACW0JT_19415 [Arthrobacter sp. SA17]
MRNNPSSASQNHTTFAPQNWTWLEAQDDVRVIDPNGQAYAASIDAKTADSSVVWIRRQDIGTRHMLDHRDGTRIVSGT